MPLYKMIIRSGVVKISVEVNAPSAELSEAFLRREFSRLFRNFPTGQFYVSQDAWQQEYGATFEPAVPLTNPNTTHLQGLVGNVLYVLNDHYITFRNTQNGIMQPHVKFSGLVAGETVVISGCSSVPDGTYTVLSRSGEIRKY